MAYSYRGRGRSTGRRSGTQGRRAARPAARRSARRVIGQPAVRLVIEQAPGSVMARPEVAGLVAKRKGRASF